MNGTGLKQLCFLDWFSVRHWTKSLQRVAMVGLDIAKNIFWTRIVTQDGKMVLAVAWAVPSSGVVIAVEAVHDRH